MHEDWSNRVNKLSRAEKAVREVSGINELVDALMCLGERIRAREQVKGAGVKRQALSKTRKLKYKRVPRGGKS